MPQIRDTSRLRRRDYRSIKVGLSRDIIAQYVNDGTVEIRDLTPLAHEMSAHLVG
jgi:hypothetical protein